MFGLVNARYILHIVVVIGVCQFSPGQWLMPVLQPNITPIQTIE